MKAENFTQKKETFLSKSKSQNIDFIKKVFLKKIKTSVYIRKNSMFTIYRNEKGSLCAIGDAYRNRVKNIIITGLTIEDAQK
jgi:hypothetical protein